MKKGILVIGSVLLDILGIYKKEYNGMVDKPGTLKYSVGGVAYNIAANLSAKAFPVFLLTCLKKDSLSSYSIKNIIKKSSINDKYVFEVDHIDEIGFMAQLCEAELTTCVTSSVIDQISWDAHVNLELAVKEAGMVVVDTNLSDTQISQIAQYCKKYDKKLLVNVVSDAKARRIYKREFDKKFLVVCMNVDEFEALGEEIKETCEKDEIEKICSRFNALKVILLKDTKSYLVLDSCGTITIHEGFLRDGINNKSGAVEALFSAVCASVFLEQSIDCDGTKLRIIEWMSAVLSSDNANLGVKLEEQDKLKIKRKNSYTGIVFLLLSVVLLLSGAFCTVNPLMFGILLFGCAMCSGVAGTSLRGIVYSIIKREYDSLPPLLNVFLGLAVGFLTTLMAILQNLSVADNVELFRQAPEKFGLLMFVSSILSMMSGLALETFFAKIIDKKLPEMEESYGHGAS